MISSSILMLIMSLSFTLFMAINPVSLGIMILMMALLLAMVFAYMMSSWVAFLIFLIYIGGMLVMFSYFVAIVPNQTLSMKDIMMSMTSSMLSISIITSVMNMKLPLLTMFTNQFNTLYSKSNIYTLIMLACILLITMIIVVKLTTLSKGPLRPFISNYV